MNELKLTDIIQGIFINGTTQHRCNCTHVMVNGLVEYLVTLPDETFDALVSIMKEAHANAKHSEESGKDVGAH